MIRPDAVLKVGGSLSQRPATLHRLMGALGKAARRYTLVVVPGGGPFADAVRSVDRRFRLDNSASHWMAILAMDQYAHLLTSLAPGAQLFQAAAGLRRGRLNILQATAWLRDADALPHSWMVTSDSIAAWVARRLRAKMLVLVKDVDGQFDRDPAHARARLLTRIGRHRMRGVVDRYLARALGPRLPCWIINGRYPQRALTLLETGAAYGTRVV